ncbi:MFS transporter [Kaistia sp. 32K]|uniref:MFS transporter n=1 Tax=Kaistia sp. 32K TaxID=2795690 RepID=UPI0019167D39|nr:MFS transporter [Kaistia sp. 32K]BCP55209.1 MFS transporter [Kaistia sp. 32K]
MSDNIVSEVTPSLRGWLAVCAVALCGAVFCTTEFLPVGILRYIGTDLGVSDGTAGLMITIPGILAALAGPLVTLGIGKIDRRHVLWLLTALLIAANVLAMSATSFEMLLAGRVLFGIGLGGFWAIGVGIAARLVPTRSVGRATSVIFTSISVGLLVGGPAGSFIGEAYGWRYAFGLAMVLSLAAIVLLLVALPPLRVAQRVTVADFVQILRTRNGVVGIVAMFLIVVAHFGTYTYVTAFLSENAGFSGTAISITLLVYTLVGMLGNFVGGAASDVNVKATLVSGILLACLSIALLPGLSGNALLLVLVIGAWGFAYGVIPIALQMWLIKAAPNAHEGGTALYVTNFQTSIALGSLLGGILVDRAGLSLAMYAGAAVAALSLTTIVTMAGDWAPKKQR